MSRLLGDDVGGTVGYRVRLDTRVSAHTRIEVVTEGVLTRMLHDDPSLEGVGLVIFDEFHERSLHADVGLALTLQTRALLRDDLRLLVMSATLDGGPIAALLGSAAGAGDVPAITSAGRAYPVEVRWAEQRPAGRIENAVATVVREAVRREPGDVLVFLPGAGEIRRVEALLGEWPLPADTRVFPLHGSLAQGVQDEAIRPSAPGRRKVVLATSIAETSLTIEGVRVVIDSGVARVPRFSPRTGMTGLETVRVTRASAEQRCGRAGRVAPGICYRLWPEAEQAGLVPFQRPEILEADLAPLALELASSGVHDPAELRWLDPPPAAAFAQARELLHALGALDAGGRLTSTGTRMAALALHPRLARMLLAARELGESAAATACDLAALIGERDVLRGEAGPPPSDVRLRLALLQPTGRDAGGAHAHGLVMDRDALRRVKLEARHWRERMKVPADAHADDAHAGALLALAYPDRVGQRRPGAGGRFLLRNGRGAVFAPGDAMAESAWIVAAALDDRKPESRVFLAAPVSVDEVLEEFGDQVERMQLVEWDATARAVIARRRERLGAIVLADAPLRDPDPALVSRVLLEAIRAEGIGALPWSESARRLRERMAFAHAVDASWPDASDTALLSTLDDWLTPHLAGVRRLDEAARVDLAEALLGRLTWEQRRALDELAPTHLVVPSGSRLPLDYSNPAAPALAVRLQELFGLAETPRVGRGRVPVVLQLLSPAHRPVQVTRDLAGFWRTSYFDVRKDLRGRYPKHHWPENPMEAAPTARAKKRGE
jgi:ATP-dependent helicase HrpB